MSLKVKGVTFLNNAFEYILPCNYNSLIRYRTCPLSQNVPWQPSSIIAPPTRQHKLLCLLWKFISLESYIMHYSVSIHSGITCWVSVTCQHDRNTSQSGYHRTSPQSHANFQFKYTLWHCYYFETSDFHKNLDFCLFGKMGKSDVSPSSAPTFASASHWPVTHLGVLFDPSQWTFVFSPQSLWQGPTCHL